MENHNPITGCTGRAVKVRHCPATVEDKLPNAEYHCAQREGDIWVPSQETGPVRNAKHFRGGVHATSVHCCFFASYFSRSLVC